MKKLTRLLACICILACVSSLTGCGSKAAKPAVTYTPTYRPIATPKPTVKPSTRIGVSSSWTGTPRTGMYVPTIPKAWEWVGSDFHTVKNSAGKDIQTGKYHYYTENTMYTIYVDKDDTVVKVESTSRARWNSGNNSSTHRSVMPSPDTSGYYGVEEFFDYYRDYFIDYEDAEDYYYSHGGW